MRHIITLSALFLSFTLFAQKEELYYFCSVNPSMVGVKTSSGKVVIPPTSGLMYSIPGEKVTGREIFLLDSTDKSRDSMAYNYHMKIFDRKGKFLYCPYWFDNGPDYYVEGLRRFVEKGKMGFVDRNGKKVIPAKYNYMDPFYRGYAVACIDCKYTRFNKDEEHCCGYAGSKYAIIDRSGNVVHTLKANKDFALNDSVLTALKLLHPFNAKEKSLIKSLEKLDEVKRFMRYNQDKYALVIAEKPKNPSGLYLVVFRSSDDSGDDLSFLIKGDGKTIFHTDHWGEEQSLIEWRKGK